MLLFLRAMSLTRLLTLFKDPSYQETIKKPLTLHPGNTCCNLLIYFQQQSSCHANQYGRRTAGHMKRMSGRVNGPHLSSGDRCWKYNINMRERQCEPHFRAKISHKQTNKIICFPFWLLWLICCIDPGLCGPVMHYLANSILINYLISKWVEG